jgi:putative FmdB family regulatory protein
VPTYQYACTECGHRFDAVQAFTDDALTTCPNCSGKLRKVFSAVGVVFKGSGFYRTDSRSSNTASSAPVTASGSKDSGSKDSGSKDSGSKDSSSSDSKPASKPATSTAAAS